MFEEQIGFKEVWKLMPKWSRAIFVLGIISIMILIGGCIFLGLVFGTDLITEDIENLRPMPTKTIKIAKPSQWNEQKF